MNSITRRSFSRMTAALLTAGPFRRAHSASYKTLRFVAQADLRALDPIWTTAYLTRNHGYCVFDTLFAIDNQFVPHPQMVGDYDVSSDNLTFRFKLRDGLGFHDGSPVRGRDCVASIRRWMTRDSHGQSLALVLDEIKEDGEKAFTLRVREPFPLLLDAFAKVSSIPLFIMPERLANTDSFTQVTDMVGSGPFRFIKEEFQPGHRVVYLRNNDYLARKEPPNWASGGKVVKAERVEWLYLPDTTTKLAALQAGEVDWWENPPLDVVPLLARNPDITVARSDPLPSPSMVKFNHLHPPFDNVKMRQAVLAAVDQVDFLIASAGDRENWAPCPSYFTCGTPMMNEHGSVALTGPRDSGKARRLIAEAGYNGQKIVILDAIDQPVIHAQALVIADVLQKLGLTVDQQVMDWGTLVTRRASMEPVDRGGWSIFTTGWVGADLLDPGGHLALRTNGKKGHFGWPSDDKIEELRAAWLRAGSLNERKKLAAEIQSRAFEIVPYLPTGQWMPKTAYRKNLKGIIQAPAFLMWNVEKV